MKGDGYQGNRRGAEAAEIAEGSQPWFSGIQAAMSSLRPPRPLRLCSCLDAKVVG